MGPECLSFLEEGIACGAVVSSWEGCAFRVFAGAPLKLDALRPAPLLDGALELPPAAGETAGRCACSSLRHGGGQAGARGTPCGHVRSSRRARGPASCCSRPAGLIDRSDMRRSSARNMTYPR